MPRCEMCRRPSGDYPGMCSGGCCDSCGSPSCYHNAVAWHLRPPGGPTDTVPVEVQPLPAPGHLYEPLIAEAEAYADRMAQVTEDDIQIVGSRIMVDVAPMIRKLADALRSADEVAADDARALRHMGHSLKEIAETLTGGSARP